MGSDKYSSFAELAQCETYGKDYLVRTTHRPDSPVLILAPHGGLIEEGTSELAGLIAGDAHNLFSFEGLKRTGNRALHITSSRFDHPDCLALLGRCAVAVGVHGCLGASGIFVGGLDAPLVELLTHRLEGAGFPASAHGHRYPGKHRLNICNRTTRHCGGQIELTMDLRSPRTLLQIAAAVRGAMEEHLASLGLWSKPTCQYDS